MNNYTLLIKCLDYIWRNADFGDDKPSMNYQVNDIAELKDRQSNYSQQLKLPITPKNTIIFGSADNIDVPATEPFRRLECRLFCDDVLISGRDSYVVLLTSKDTYNVQILSGTNDFFTTISARQVSELDLGKYILGSKKPEDNYSDENYCIPRCGLVKDYPYDTNHMSIPFYFLKTAINKIVNNYKGYTLITNVDNNEFSTAILNVETLKQSSDSFSEFLVYCEATGESSPDVGKYFTYDQTKLYDNKNLCEFNYGYQKITIPFDCKLKLAVNFQKYGTSEAKAYAQIDLYNKTGVDENGHNTYERVAIISDANNYLLNSDETLRYTEFTFDGIKDGYIRIAPYLTTGDVTTFAHKYWLTILSAENLSEGCRLNIANNTGFEKQFDLFKYFVQLYGLIVDVDNDNKIVYAYTFDKIIQNKTLAKDWSRKLNNSITDISFQKTEYAQINTIKFTDNETIKDEGVFSIDNNTLAPSKTLFTLASTAGIDINQGVTYFALLPFYELSEDDGIITYKYNGCGKHLLHYITTTDIYTTKHIKIQPLIDSNYGSLVNTLQRYRLIENYFNLIAEDVSEHDSFVPVWIDYYGAYFYVNKIKNFTAGNLTKVELLKL